MKVNDTMHSAQVAILHALLFKPSASFAQLQKSSALSSDHFNFHLKKMLEQKLILKNADGHYEFTPKGKEFANQFDTDNKTVERQPKVSVLLVVQGNDGEWLCQQRLKQPFYGYWARPTGKIRYGETIMECAARELLEETNLIADFEYRGIYHKMDYAAVSGELLEDKIFFVMFGTNPKGKLLQEFEGGRNAWLSVEEIRKLDKAFVGLDEGSELIGDGFQEHRFEYTKDEF